MRNRHHGWRFKKIIRIYVELILKNADGFFHPIVTLLSKNLSAKDDDYQKKNKENKK
jgi:hypothetical protein